MSPVGYWNPAGLLGVKGDLQMGPCTASISPASPSTITSAWQTDRFGQHHRLHLHPLRHRQHPQHHRSDRPSGNIDYDRITSFSSADHAFYGVLRPQDESARPAVGGNVKVIYRRVGSFGKAWGFGLDAGAQYQKDRWRFSAVARDVTSTFNAWSYSLDQRTIDVFAQTGNDIPANSVELTLPRLNLGIAREFKFGSKFDLLAAIDLENTFDGKRNTLIKSNAFSTDPRVGIELGYAGVVYVRTGVSNIQYVTDINDAKQLSIQPNIGLGLKIKSVSLDYALTDIGDNSVALYSNIFSLKFDLFKKQGS
jgi:hypothetical protein